MRANLVRLQVPSSRRRRYLESMQDQVSEPDEWAEIHYSHLPWDNYERMVAFSRANQLRLNNAIESLNQRREQTEANGNWEQAAQCTRAIEEIVSLQAIA